MRIRFIIEGIIIILMSMAVMMIFTSICNAQEYSDKQIADAIWFAEGGSKADYPYGIRSLKYEDRTDKSLSRQEWARMICLNTIRNNRKRYTDYGYKEYDTFLEFLQSRYCPTKGNLSPAEKRLNGNWLRNILYYLEVK